IYHIPYFIWHMKYGITTSPKLLWIPEPDLGDGLLRAHQKPVRERRQRIRGEHGAHGRVVDQAVRAASFEITRGYLPVHQREDSPVARDAKLHDDILGPARVIRRGRIVIAAQDSLNDLPVSRTARHSGRPCIINARADADSTGH